ncbi:MAG TPA: phosphoglycerate dehydrogenase [Vicinamibacterales bacterium]
MFKVRTLNNIAPIGLSRFPTDVYQVGGADVAEPDAILVRSADMHAAEIPGALKAVGRAGAGVNNIPVARMSERGIPVFNAPGANANAVKELVMAGLVLASRQICEAWDFARGLEGSDEEINRAVEAGKKKFAGFELPGRILGVVGLGAIGRLVANAGVALGMQVVGFDPGLTVEGAWQLSASVRKARSLDEVIRASDFLTVHVPLADATRHLVKGDRLTLMKKGAVLLNFAREGIVDEQAVIAALDAGHLHAYVCDFPTNATRAHRRCVALPHLGASTAEAEDNCAVMVVDQIRDFLENGNVRNAVNFPEVVTPRQTAYRLVCANANVPTMLGQISDALGHAGLNIHSMANSSRAEVAYTVVDLDSPLPASVLEHIASIKGVLMARMVAPPR